MLWFIPSFFGSLLMFMGDMKTISMMNEGRFNETYAMEGNLRPFVFRRIAIQNCVR